MREKLEKAVRAVLSNTTITNRETARHTISSHLRALGVQGDIQMMIVTWEPYERQVAIIAQINKTERMSQKFHQILDQQEFDRVRAEWAAERRRKLSMFFLSLLLLLVAGVAFSV